MGGVKKNYALTQISNTYLGNILYESNADPLRLEQADSKHQAPATTSRRLRVLGRVHYFSRRKGILNAEIDAKGEAAPRAR